jgi:hypothetical protein
MTYRKLEDIPLHIFSNKECTQSPNLELLNYLRYMHTNHIHDLEYLWRFTQSYSNYGGCYLLGFEAWLTKLDKDLTKQGIK